MSRLDTWRGREGRVAVSANVSPVRNDRKLVHVILFYQHVKEQGIRRAPAMHTMLTHLPIQ